MNSAVTIRAAVSIRQADSIAYEIESAYDEITRRAYELFLSRPNGSAIDIEDWLEAERQILIKPAALLTRTADGLEVRFQIRPAEAASFEVVIAGQMLLIQSLGDYSPRIFRTVNLPNLISPVSAEARVEECAIIITVKAGCNTAVNAV
jgi:hypothetical protein